METKTVTVPNISCEHCVHTIQNEVGELEGVRSVKADEKTRQVTIQWEKPANWDKIEHLMAEINYPPETLIQL